MPGLSNWREEFNLSEVVTGKMTDKEALKKVSEKKGINNKVVINPKLDEAVKEIGGEVISMSEADTTAQKQRIDMKQMILDRQKLKIRRKDFVQKKREGENVDSTGASKQADIIAQEETIKQVNEKKRKNALQIQKVIGEELVNEADPRLALYQSGMTDASRVKGRVGKAVDKVKDKVKKVLGKKDKVSSHLDRYRFQSGLDNYLKSKVKKEEVVLEKDLNAAERRALPDKDFALPGKGKGPEGKQAGSYPIPDEKHARSALSLVAQHGTPEEKATVRAKVKKKFPNIEVNEGVMKMVKRVMAKKKPEKKAEKAMDAGAKARRVLKRREHAKYVSGSEDNVPDDIREAVKGQDTEMRKMAAQDRASGKDKRLSPKEGERSVKPVRYRYNEGKDKAFDFVVKQLQKKHGKDAVVTKDNPIKPPTEAQKKAAAAHRAKLAKQDHRDPTEIASSGRYSDRYSNRGSD